MGSAGIVNHSVCMSEQTNFGDRLICDYIDFFVSMKERSGVIERSTVRDYHAVARLIVRYIGTCTVSDVEVMAVSDWMASMVKDGYAPKTCSKAFRLLSQALKFAVGQGAIDKNPCDFCKPPKQMRSRFIALDRAERSRMLYLARQDDSPLGFAIEIALTTGMRRGEVCALKWSDFSSRGTLTVRRALGNAEGGFYIKEPKSLSGIRTIPLASDTNEALGRLKGAFLEANRSEGGASADGYIVGAGESGDQPYNPDRLGRDFAQFCRDNGFECTFRDLRHTFATFMVGAGVDVRTVASLLGHANVAMTLNIYAEADPEAKRRAAGAIERAFDDAAWQRKALTALASEAGLKVDGAGPCLRAGFSVS
ncbi:site-specific recombinase, phage integrase family [Slackia sp. CM382]|uniref:tyrosine-type recombinase/integrase n=1 Tax=Slackia sp. CM382 TaxID=1111137 RepID=UPI00027C4968|nr:site-specific integrase [Slackia sp. CM382]EJU34341.1 site-specific recombinase, phage integrase family [Slackia sp. CM382]